MPSRLRVHVIGPYPPVEGKISGGVQAVTYYLSEGLAARDDLEVHVITSVSGIESSERTSSAGATVHLVPCFERFGCMTGFAVDAARIRRVMRRVRPDVVHVHTQTMYAHAALERGYPTLFTPHGVFFKEAELVRGFMNRLQSRLGTRYERAAFRRAKHIALLNRYLADCFGSLLGGKNVHFIDNPIDDKFFEIPNQPEPGAIMFIGTIIPRKGLLHLAEAAAILKRGGFDFKVWVVGPVVDREYFSSVKQFVSENGLGDRFEFTGLVSEEEVMDRYSRCSILALPSFEETAPMAISQAQAVGKPVVATAVGGVPEMVSEGETGYTVAFGDAEALADRIGRLLSDPEGSRRMGERARSVAESRYRRAAVVDKTVRVYEELIGGRAEEPFSQGKRIL